MFFYLSDETRPGERSLFHPIIFIIKLIIARILYQFKLSSLCFVNF